MKINILLGSLAMLPTLCAPLPIKAATLDASDAEVTAREPSVIDIAMRSVVTISYGAEEDDPDGSGFVAHASGLIVTNAHVVARTKGDTVRVSFADGRTFTGTVVGRDPRTDLAVVRIEPDEPLIPLKLAPTSKAGLGTKVFALGSPMGKRFSVTAGIVSGYDRAYDAAWPVDFLQHDAALNPGNSGGPLIDEQGRVLGVNTATPPETLFDMGIALAIPAELVARIVPELAAKGEVDRGALGVKVSSADPAIAAALGAEGEKGLLVDEVLPGSAAAQAGVKIGDIILAIGERRLRLARDLSLALLDSRPGETRAITLIRNGTRRIEQVALGKDDPSAGERGRVATLSLYPIDTSGKNRTFGATFSERDGSIVIVSVEEGSLAQLYGLYEGDIILAVNGQQPGDLGSLQARVGSMGGDVAVLRIQREGMGTFHVALPLTARASQERRPGDQKRFPQGPL